MHNLAIALQALVAASIFFVWVVRYANVVDEFKQYELPNWLRDFVGILKMTFALFLLIGMERGVFAVLGGIAIAVLCSGSSEISTLTIARSGGASVPIGGESRFDGAPACRRFDRCSERATTSS